MGVADYFLLDAECHSAVLERMRWSLNGGGTKRRWPDFVEAVEHAYGLKLVDNETPRLMEARKVLVRDSTRAPEVQTNTYYRWNLD